MNFRLLTKKCNRHQKTPISFNIYESLKGILAMGFELHKSHHYDFEQQNLQISDFVHTLRQSQYGPLRLNSLLCFFLQLPFDIY